MILPSSEGVLFGARTVDGKLCIGDTSLRKYIKKYKKTMRIRYKTTCVCKTCISVMLLQSDLNKWRILKLDKFDNLYINSAPTRLLQRPNNDFIE